MAESAVSPSVRSRLVTIGLWLLVLTPLLLCARLAYLYSVDQRFLDDWVWAPDLVKWKEGKYGELIHDLCSVHLEHRPMVPRTLALFVTLALKGNVQGQNVLSFLWLALTSAALCRLWMRHGGLTIRNGWLPLFIGGAALFTPIQWQTLLWPICHETPMPVMFFLFALLAAFKPWRWWVRCFTGTLCAILAMLSFASGFLMWVLPLPVFLFCGAFRNRTERIRFVIVWAVVLCVTMMLYLKITVQSHDSITLEKPLLSLPGGYAITYDLHNEVSPQYSYGHKTENTMNGEVAAFLSSPALDIDFVATFSGALLMRGWSADLKTAAETTGWILLAGWGAAAIYLWRNRNDETLRAGLLPMLCYAAYTPMTGLMVAVGRANAGGTGTALNGRYSVHQTALLVGLMGAMVFIGRHRAAKRAMTFAQPTTPEWALAGLMTGVLAVGWVHGAAMMWEWQAARWRGAAAQYLSQEFKRYNPFVSFIAGNHGIARNGAADLDRVGLLPKGLARDRKLSNFPVAKRTPDLADDEGEFERLYKNEAGEWRVQGFAHLPGNYRPADAVLLTYRNAQGEWIMFGFTQSWGAPYYLTRSMGKDMYAIIPGRDPWPQRVMCPWSPDVYLEEEPPPGALITAWALDMKLRIIHRIPHRRDNKPDSPDGSSLVELARDDVDP